jgi:hypothetical protein
LWLAGAIWGLRLGQAFRAISHWFQRQRDNLIQDALIGFVVLGIGLAAAAWWDSRLTDRQNQVARDLASANEKLSRDLANASEIQENIRFVRPSRNRRGGRETIPRIEPKRSLASRP